MIQGSEAYVERKRRDVWASKMMRLEEQLPGILKYDTAITKREKNIYLAWAKEHRGKHVAYAVIRRSNQTEEPLIDCQGIFENR